MVSRPASPPRLLRALRSRDWRGLLLAFALLSAWSQALLPSHAGIPHAVASHAALPAVAGAWLCVAEDGAAEPGSAPAGEACPYCRLHALGADVPPPPSLPAPPPRAAQAEAAPRRAAPASLSIDRPRLRGPPIAPG
ncbi:MAG: hypothetical protein ACKOUS_15290, partial [Alphaproteobacteria bacterium]